MRSMTTRQVLCSKKPYQIEIGSFYEKNVIVRAQAGFLWQHEGIQETVPIFICNLKFEFF